MCRSGTWRGGPGRRTTAIAWQRPDGRVVVRADGEGLERARFMLALDDDTSGFHDRFAATRCSVRLPERSSATGRSGSPPSPTRPCRAMCGQLIEAGRAAAIERSILRRLGAPSPPATACPGSRLPTSAATGSRRRGDACSGSPHARPRAPARARHRVVLRRLGRERGIGPWSVGVIALEGLGRYDHGLVGDLGLVKLMASLRGRWVEAGETAELLAPYAEWQGLAGLFLMLGWSRGLIPGADPESAAARGFARSVPPEGARPPRAAPLDWPQAVNERRIAVLGRREDRRGLISGLLSSGWREPADIVGSSRRASG